MKARETLTRLLSSSTADDLRRLRGDLLELELDTAHPVWDVITRFHGFVDQLETSTSSRDYSHLASMLDISAIGGVLAEQTLENEGPSVLAMRLFSSLVSEGLMVLATRQHVKAWEGELDSVYRSTAWFLYDELWSWARERKPELPATERRHLLDELLAPVYSTDVEGLHKAALISRLFQILLLSRLAEALQTAG